MDLVVQCKRYSKNLGVGEVREFEATVLRISAATGRSAVGILCTAAGLTAGASRHLLAMQAPAVAARIPLSASTPASVLVNVPAQLLLPRDVHARIIGGRLS